MSGTIRLRELVQVTKASRVDRTQGILYGLVILGPDSDNNRHYTEQAMRSAARLYEGQRGNADHVKAGGEPSVYNRIGVWRNVALGNDGRLRGDFHVLKSHPLADRLIEAAERPSLHSLFGFSHDAEGTGRTDANGRQLIESIERVHSVDLVADPASVSGLYESRNSSRRNRPMKPKRNPDAALFAHHFGRVREGGEGFGSAGDDTAPDTTPGGGGEPADPVEAAIALLQQCLDDSDQTRHNPAFLKAVQDAIDALQPFAGGDEGGQVDAEESLHRRRLSALRDGNQTLREMSRSLSQADDAAARKERVRRLRMGNF